MKDEFTSSISDRHFSVGTSNSTHTYSAPGKFTKHYHDWFEIYRLINGKCHYFVDDTVYDLISGDIVLIPPYHTHSVFFESGRYFRSIINISSGYVPSFTKELIEKKGLVYRIPEINDEICNIHQKIENEYYNWDNCSNHIMSGYILVFMGLLLRNHNLFINEHVCMNPHINEVIKYVQQNFHSDITLTHTANIHSISPEYLARMFKQETGITFHNYLTNIRLKEAERLLKKRNNTISEIAYACGFNDSNYFSTKFKSIYGVTPVHFRNQYKSLVNDDTIENTSSSSN